MNKRVHEPGRRFGNAVLWLLLAAVAVLWAVPILWSLAVSLRPENVPISVGSAWWGGGLTLSNFQRAWESVPFASYYVNTIFVVVGILALQLVTVTLGAYAFARMKFPLRDFLFVIFLLQLMVPAEALVVANFNTIRVLHLIDTRWGIIVPYAASAFGTFLLRQTFKQVPQDLEDAAFIDGCGPLKTLWLVFVPLARPTLVAYGLVTVSYHWNNFFWPLIITNRDEVRPLTVGLARFTQMSETGADWALIAAGTLIVVLPLLAVFLIFQKQFVDSFLRSGIK